MELSRSDMQVPTWRRPTESDWAEKRGLIEAMHGNRTFDQIRLACRFIASYARSIHHANVTDPSTSDKMFRTRFRRWKLPDKRNKEHEISALLRKYRERNAIDKVSQGRIHGKPVNMQEIVRYARRKRMSLDQLERRSRSRTPPGIECRTPSPIAIDPPIALGNIETVFRLIYNYTAVSFRGPEWAPFDTVPNTGLPSEALSIGFYNSVLDAYRIHRENDHILAELLFNHAFKQLPSILLEQDKHMVYNLLIPLPYLYVHKSYNSSLWVLKHIANASETTLPQSHPLRHFWRLLSECEHHILDTLGFRIYQIQVRCIEAARGVRDREAIRAKLRLLGLGVWYGLSNNNTDVLQQAHTSLINLEYGPHQRDRLVNRMAYYYCESRLYEQCLSFLDYYLKLHLGCCPVHVAGRWVIKGRCHWKLGQPDLAITSSLKAVQILHASGHHESRILVYLAQLRSYLKARSRLEEAETAHAAYKSLKRAVLEVTGNQMTRSHVVSGRHMDCPSKYYSST
jgi:hypothetical protein